MPTRKKRATATTPNRTEFPAWLWIAGPLALVLVVGAVFYTMAGGSNASRTAAPAPASTTGAANRVDPTSGEKLKMQTAPDPTGGGATRAPVK